MNSNQVKAYLRSLGHKSVRVSTTPTKQSWITAWIPSDRAQIHKLVYNDAPFSVEFRKRCLGVVYPNSPEIVERADAGNVRAYSIAMLPHEWSMVFETMENEAVAAAEVVA